MRVMNERMLFDDMPVPVTSQTGADRATIDSCSTRFKYKKTIEDDKSNATEKEDEVCAICCAEFVEEEEVRYVL